VGDLVVPDIAEALVGWRSWGLARTADGIRIVSHGSTIWPAGSALAATCAAGKRHDSPARECRCGIYALLDHDLFPYYEYDGPAYAVFGPVYLWGEVIQGTKGFRAEYAYPKALYVAHRDWRYAQPLREAYRVPVALRNPFSEEVN
jgi:hypothetical protein